MRYSQGRCGDAPAKAAAAWIKQAKLTRTGLLGALALHGVDLQQVSCWGRNTCTSVGRWPLSAAVWLGLVVFWLESLLIRHRRPAAAVAAGSRYRRNRNSRAVPQAQLVPYANSPWLRAYSFPALAAYGLITIAALHAMLMALLDRHLHRPLDAPAERSIVGRVAVQPPLPVQERLLLRVSGSASWS